MGCLILFAAFPPLGLSPLAWIAPIFFVLPIKHPTFKADVAGG